MERKAVISIRPAVRDDAAEIAAVHVENWRSMFAAEDRGRFVGFPNGAPNTPTAEKCTRSVC
jgi:hypothetical protein